MKKIMVLFVVLLTTNVFASAEWTFLSTIAAKKVFDEVIDVQKTNYDATVRQVRDGCENRALNDTVPFKKARVAYRLIETQISSSATSIRSNFVCEMAYVQ